MVIGLSGFQFGLLITSMITDRIGRHEVPDYQLIITMTISEKRIAKLRKKEKICIKIPAKEI